MKAEAMAAAGEPESDSAYRRLGALGLYREIWRYAEGKRGIIVLAYSLLLTSQILKLSLPYLSAQAINLIQAAGPSYLINAGWYLLAVFGTLVVSWILHGPGRIMERNVAIHIRQNLADQLTVKLLELPLAWHEEEHSGETIKRVDQSTRALYDFAQTQFIYLQNFVNLVGPIVALFLISRLTGLAALVGYALIALVITSVDRTMMRIADKENEAERHYHSALVDALGNIVSVLALRLQASTRRLLGERLASIVVPLKQAIVLNEAKWCIVDLMNAALWCSLVALYAWLSRRGATEAGNPLLIGNVFMVFQYTQQAGGVISAIALFYQSFTRHQVDFASAVPILTATVEKAPRMTLLPTVADRLINWRTIDLEDLTFWHAHSRSKDPALQDISLRFQRGKRLALVGESGSGKSTLMRTLAGLYFAQNITLSADGVRLNHLHDLAAIAMLIPQDAEVFEATLRQNLTMGQECPPEVLAAVIDAARLQSLVDELPDGLETEIAERGANFSGGQKQRIALARGLIAAWDASILFLDEPTSNLDAPTEAAIYEKIFELYAENCVVSSVHRPHLLTRFDEVIFMVHGRIVDVGTAAELSERQPAFRVSLEKAAAKTTGGQVPGTGDRV
jgi:ABC-type multidrug transport system fused ATPase/permease subunit